MFRRSFAFVIVLTTQDTSSRLERVQATILREYKSIMLVKYTNPLTVQIYVISEHQTALGVSGLNCSCKIFCSSSPKLECCVVAIHGFTHCARIPTLRLFKDFCINRACYFPRMPMAFFNTSSASLVSRSSRRSRAFSFSSSEA